MRQTAVRPDHRLRLSEIEPAAGRPPLSYSLPAFHPRDWAEAPRQIEALRALGFRWVTLHPTYIVYKGLRIGSGPSAVQCIAAARASGMRVRLEPHLDYESTLTGGPYQWRRDMLLDPVGQYLTEVLEPLAALQPDELTLGSELDDSAAAYPDAWAAAADLLRPSGVRLGHKLNHDWQGGDNLVEYLKILDYVALSWYVPDFRPIPDGYVIGELGLGSVDVLRPWHFDASTFRSAEALALRRRWYIDRLHWLQTVRSPGAACFWTAGHFDVLGIMHPEWSDKAVLEAVRAYNYASSALTT